MSAEDLGGLVGHTMKPYVDNVYGFVKALPDGNRVEGLLITHEGVDYVMPIVSRDEFDKMLGANVRKGFSLFEINDPDRPENGGES
jgi:hypothetical protein